VKTNKGRRYPSLPLVNNFAEKDIGSQPSNTDIEMKKWSFRKKKELEKKKKRKRKKSRRSGKFVVEYTHNSCHGSIRNVLLFFISTSDPVRRKFLGQIHKYN